MASFGQTTRLVTCQGSRSRLHDNPTVSHDCRNCRSSRLAGQPTDKVMYKVTHTYEDTTNMTLRDVSQLRLHCTSYNVPTTTSRALLHRQPSASNQARVQNQVGVTQAVNGMHLCETPSSLASEAGLLWMAVRSLRHLCLCMHKICMRVYFSSTCKHYTSVL